MSDLKQVITDFLNTEAEAIEIPMTPVQDVAKILTELGYDELELSGDETNGWQIDFWYYFYNTVAGPKLCLSGSLHYGDFKLSKEHE